MTRRTLTVLSVIALAVAVLLLRFALVSRSASSPPAEPEEAVVVALVPLADNGAIVALRGKATEWVERIANDGTVRWRRVVPNGMPVREAARTILVVDSAVLVPQRSPRGNVVDDAELALDLESGRVLWAKVITRNDEPARTWLPPDFVAGTRVGLFSAVGPDRSLRYYVARSGEPDGPAVGESQIDLGAILAPSQFIWRDPDGMGNVDVRTGNREHSSANEFCSIGDRTLERSSGDNVVRWRATTPPSIAARFDEPLPPNASLTACARRGDSLVLAFTPLSRRVQKVFVVDAMGKVEQTYELGELSLDRPFASGSLPRFLALPTSSPDCSGRDKRNPQTTLLDLDTGGLTVLPARWRDAPRLVDHTWVVETSDAELHLLDGETGRLVAAYSMAWSQLIVGDHSIWLIDNQVSSPLDQLRVARIDPSSGIATYYDGGAVPRDITNDVLDEIANPR